MNKWPSRWQRIVQHALLRPLGTLGRNAWGVLRRAACAIYTVLGITIRRFGEAEATAAAASMAYYALFALFPLLLFLIYLASAVLHVGDIRRQILELVAQLFPTSHEVIIENVQQVLVLRGATGIISGIALLWSSLGFFTGLGKQINRAWPQARSRNFWEGRLLALSMVGILAALLILWLLLATALRLLPYLDLPLWELIATYGPLLRTLLATVLPWVVSFGLFFVLYRWVPRAKVRWHEALWGALLATVGWRLATVAFVWYVGSGLSRYLPVYGSLSSIIALLFWAYISNVIVLFGAHLSAAIAAYRRLEREEPQRRKELKGENEQ